MNHGHLMRTAGFVLFAIVFFSFATKADSQLPAGVDLEHIGPADAARLTHEWLEHGTPLQHAWAAYWIARDHQAREVPALLTLVSKYKETRSAGTQGWSDEDSALEVMLDTLIQLEIDVLPEDLEAAYDRFPIQALVLLSRSPQDASEILLRLFDKAQPSIEWLALADLLAKDPPPGFTARLLKGISVHATIQVLAPGQSATTTGCGGGCGGSSAWGRGLWPPVGVYRLSQQDSSGFALLAAGEDPVYLRRVADPEHDTPDPCGDLLPDVSELRPDIIGRLLGLKKDRFALQLHPKLDLAWTTGGAYVDAASNFVAMQEAIICDVESGLETQGLLTKLEAASMSQPIEVEIPDLRREKESPPALGSIDPSITISYKAVDAPEP